MQDVSVAPHLLQEVQKLRSEATLGLPIASGLGIFRSAKAQLSWKVYDCWNSGIWIGSTESCSCNGEASVMVGNTGILLNARRDEEQEQHLCLNDQC